MRTRWPALLLGWLLLAGCVQPPPAGSAAEPPSTPVGAAAPEEETRLWQDAAILGRAGAVIEAEADRLRIEMYELGEPGLLASVAAARARGVRVQVITDPTVEASRVAAAWLRARGVEVALFPVDDRRHQIDHVKLLLTPSAALVGGMNWGRHSGRNHDFALEVTTPAYLRRLEALFCHDWAYSARAADCPSPPPGLEAPVAFTYPGEAIRAELVRAVAAARQDISAEVFTFTDPQLRAELIAARRRGVRVRLLLDRGQAVNLDPARVVAGAGVEVRWYRAAPGAKLHAKAGLFDQKLVLGSANWSLGGLSRNHELDLSTEARQPVADFSRRFEFDWAHADARNSP